nr:hypothetical protein [Bradyrhizobium diazoefficiens]
MTTPTAGGPTPWPKQVAVSAISAEASARMLGFATTKPPSRVPAMPARPLNVPE